MCNLVSYLLRIESLGPSPQIHMFVPVVRILGAGTRGRRLDHEGGAFISIVCALQKSTELPCPLP